MTAKAILGLDGCGPASLAGSETPNLDAIAREGFHTIGAAIVPTVTNVNNTSIITTSLPETHGITSNYCLDPITGSGVYMESPDYLLAETAFRSHGSLHEREIPIYALGAGPLAVQPRTNAQVASRNF